jgi:hypothetical protein
MSTNTATRKEIATGADESSKAVEPIASADLEDVALRVAQAVSTLSLLMNGREATCAPNLQNALGLVTGYLGRCAQDLSELHRRHELESEVRRA